MCHAYGRPQATLLAATVGCQAAMEAGDFVSAARRLDTIDRTAGALRQPLALGYARLRQSMWATIHGRLDESEQLADEAYEYTNMSQQPDAAAFRMGQILSIRYHQGRLDEIIDELGVIARSYPGIVAFRAAQAMVAALLGGMEEAEVGLAAILGPGATDVADDLNWLVSMSFSAVAAARLGNHDECRRVADALTPYRNQFVDNASTFWGSVELYRAVALAGADQRAAALEAFEAAARAHTELEAPLLLAETQVEWAGALMRFGHADDRPAVAALLGRALATAEQFDMRDVARRARNGLASYTH